MTRTPCIAFVALLLTTSVLAQGFLPLDTNRSVSVLLANDPFSPFIKTFPKIESGKLVLELLNGFHKPVLVKDVVLEEGDSDKSLLEEQVELVPSESAFVEVVLPLTRTLSEETLVTISLSLEPTPDHQPDPSRYRVRFENGRFTEFRKIAVSP